MSLRSWGRTVGLNVADRFLSGLFLRGVAAAKISMSMKTCSSHGFLGGGPPACASAALVGFGRCPTMCSTLGHKVSRGLRLSQCMGAVGASGEGVSPSSWKWAASWWCEAKVSISHESSQEGGQAGLCLPLVPSTSITGTLRQDRNLPMASAEGWQSFCSGKARAVSATEGSGEEEGAGRGM